MNQKAKPQSSKSIIFRLLIFILGALFMFAYLFFSGLIYYGENNLTPCNNTERYNKESNIVTAAPAQISDINNGIITFYNDQYGITLPRWEFPDSIISLQDVNPPSHGSAFISKKLLDHIFTQNTRSNGVSVYFTNQGNIKLFLIPMISDDVNFDSSPLNYYKLLAYCPPRCIY